ncbi:MAG: hypothetical protein FWD89_04990 [Firmicutes bacterium]|nr:hypothetical protein [Bacillota bacterium]
MSYITVIAVTAVDRKKLKEFEDALSIKIRDEIIAEVKKARRSIVEVANDVVKNNLNDILTLEKPGLFISNIASLFDRDVPLDDKGLLKVIKVHLMKYGEGFEKSSKEKLSDLQMEAQELAGNKNRTQEDILEFIQRAKLRERQIIVETIVGAE